MIEGLVDYVAAFGVWIELRSSEKNGKHQAELIEAEFILNYNQSFIQSTEMCSIEDKLSRWVGNHSSEYNQKDNERQLYVNYLVYLEGLADLINRDNFENADFKTFGTV